MTSELKSLMDSVREFSNERDWDQFHSPKNLACALSVEAAELLEHFQWLSEAQSYALPLDKRNEISEEAADIFLYLLSLAEKLDFDLIAASRRKLLLNAEKYPIDKSRGTSKKYTEL
ncbi:MAG TPA: nucleotide pyrophosphohydrolase [Casimicrobiaceae bacterium]|jgi:dCTP diphosphatase|nr:nucleotide pyrophosphohydrolase [Casimicrobiaceae bacterium]